MVCAAILLLLALATCGTCISLGHDARSRHDAKIVLSTDDLPAKNAAAPKNCGAVREFALTPCSSQTWRWSISESYNGNGPTVHWLEFGGVSGWLNSTGWTVTAKSHPNGPAANLLKKNDNTSFWNADQPGAQRHGAPWTATIKTTAEITASKMRYSIFFAGNAPMAFKVECLKDIAWTTVGTTKDAGCDQPICSCPHRPAPSPPVPPPPPRPRPAGHMKIDTVHYVSSFHLDLGFAIPNGFSAGIFDITWNPDVYHKRPEGYLFQAMNTSRALRARGGEEAMKFLPPPYLLSLGLDCPPTPILHPTLQWPPGGLACPMPLCGGCLPGGLMPPDAVGTHPYPAVTWGLTPRPGCTRGSGHCKTG